MCRRKSKTVLFYVLCTCSSEAKEVKDAVESHQRLIEDENDGASEQKSAGGK